jgi:hypothetical protein
MSADKRVLGKASTQEGNVQRPKGSSVGGKKNPTAQTERSPESSKAEGQKAIKARNDFYADGSSFMKKCAYATFGFMLVSIGSTFYSASQRENNVYFAAKPNKDIVQLVALDEPNMSNAAVTNWLSHALIDTFDFRYNNVSQRLSESANRWFTPEGGTELVRALESGGNLASVSEKELFVGLTLDSAPILIDQAKDSTGTYYAWKYEVPGQITYLTRSKTFVDKVTFKITVQRQSMISSPDGLGIAKIIMLVKR